MEFSKETALGKKLFLSLLGFFPKPPEAPTRGKGEKQTMGRVRGAFMNAARSKQTIR